ncbi:MAG: SPOR domain-containing protein, partial [Pseudomonadales bacterium]
LQLASFKNPENALNLRESLRQSEFRSYIIQARTDEEGEVYRVFVGPMLQKSRLSVIGKELESKFDLKGRIVRYRIEDDAGQLGG